MIKYTTILLLIITFFSCGETPMPKPHGYPRIELPQKGYESFISPCAFNFEKGIATIIEYPQEDSCFFNLSYPALNAKVHFSYVPVENRLKGLIDNEYKLREKHNQFSTNVQEKVYHDELKDVHALLFNISGTQSATPLQLFITDSTNHFLRGALYFNTTPNNDSLAVAIDFIRNDINRLVETLTWK